MFEHQFALFLSVRGVIHNYYFASSVDFNNSVTKFCYFTSNWDSPTQHDDDIFSRQFHARSRFKRTSQRRLQNATEAARKS